MTRKRHALRLVPPPAETTGGQPPSPPEVSPAQGDATPTPTAPLGLAAREVGMLSPAYLAQLPMAVSLALRTRGGGELWVTSSRSVHGELRRARVAVITARELCVWTTGLAEGRCSHETVGRWLASGGGFASGPTLASVAYAGAYALQMPNHNWPVSRVIHAMGLTLVKVLVGDVPNCEVMP